MFSHGFLIQLLSWKCKFRLKITLLSRLELLIRSHSVGPQTPFPAVIALPISFPTPTRLLPFSVPWKLISRLTSRLHQPFNSRKCTACILTTTDIKEERRSESNPTVPNNCALLSLTSPRPLPSLSPSSHPLIQCCSASKLVSVLDRDRLSLNLQQFFGLSFRLLFFLIYPLCSSHRTHLEVYLLSLFAAYLPFTWLLSFLLCVLHSYGFNKRQASSNHE